MRTYYAQLDLAFQYGREYADNGIAGGDTTPEDSPLSGEWAGAPTWRDVARYVEPDVDLEALETFEIDDLCDYFEDGYRSADWPSYD